MEEWPHLNLKRIFLAAVVCRDKVYVIGGTDDNGQALDTMESIQVSSLLGTTQTSTTTRQTNSQWTRLQCRLSSPRQGCAAVVVHNRYIVVLGGRNDMECLSSVDIVDTAPHNNNNGEPAIVAGPRMISTRSFCGAAVIDNRLFVVGGWVNSRPSTSVESLLFQQQEQDKVNTSSTRNVSCMFPNSSWRVEPHLTLSTIRAGHAVAKVGSCLIVAGGLTTDGTSTRGITSWVVEVLDVQRGIVWSLPELTIPRPFGCSMVSLSDCLLVLGGCLGRGDYVVDYVESLALTVNRKHENCNRLLKFLVEIEFFRHRPTRNIE